MKNILDALSNKKLITPIDAQISMNGHSHDWLVNKIKELIPKGSLRMVVATTKDKKLNSVLYMLNATGIKCFIFGYKGHSMLFASRNESRTMAAADFVIDLPPDDE